MMWYTKSMKHPGGRPTLYTPEVIEEINIYLKEAVPENMAIPTVEGIALRLGITRETLYEWGRVHPEFSDTLSKLKMMQKEALIKTGIFGGKEINATIISLLLKVNHDMAETTKTDITSGGKPITIPPLLENVSRDEESSYAEGDISEKTDN